MLVRFFFTDKFPYVFFGQFADCLSEKCYISMEVNEVVLFAKVVNSALAFTPFFVFIQNV